MPSTPRRKSVSTKRSSERLDRGTSEDRRGDPAAGEQTASREGRTRTKQPGDGKSKRLTGDRTMRELYNRAKELKRRRPLQI